MGEPDLFSVLCALQDFADRNEMGDYHLRYDWTGNKLFPCFESASDLFLGKGGRVSLGPSHHHWSAQARGWIKKPSWARPTPNSWLILHFCWPNVDKELLLSHIPSVMVDPLSLASIGGEYTVADKWHQSSGASPTFVVGIALTPRGPQPGLFVWEDGVSYYLGQVSQLNQEEQKIVDECRVSGRHFPFELSSVVPPNRPEYGKHLIEYQDTDSVVTKNSLAEHHIGMISTFGKFWTPKHEGLASKLYRIGSKVKASRPFDFSEAEWNVLQAHGKELGLSAEEVKKKIESGSFKPEAIAHMREHITPRHLGREKSTKPKKWWWK